MRIADDVVLDPGEFSVNRTELNLSEEGLTIEEATWGDTEIDAFMVRRDEGEVPADRHPPNRTIELALRVRGEGAVDLPTVAHRLQQKVALMNREGGWLRRDFYAGGDFATSVGYRVHHVSLANLSSWQKGVGPDVLLKLTCSPYCYATTEQESKVFTETSARELIYELENLLGSAPGLIRIRVTNDNGEDDWRGLVHAMESRDYREGATAALAHEAKDLTPLGGASEAEREGEKVVRHTSLAGNWQAILGSEIDGVGHMTHAGVRRIWARIYDPGSTPGNVQLRLEWRNLGTVQWNANAIVSTPLCDDFALVDLGECRLEEAVIGEQKWEWRITARAVDTAGADIDIHLVWVLPTEQFLAVQQPIHPLITPTAFSAWDEFDQSAGALNGKALPDGSGNWATEGSAKGDFETTGDGAAKRTKKEDGDWRRAVCPASAQLVVAATLSFYWSALPNDNLESEVLRSELYWGNGAETGMLAYYNNAAGLSYLTFFNQPYDYEWEAGVHYTLTMLIVGGEYAMGWVTRDKKLPSGPPDYFTYDTGWTSAKGIEFADLYSGQETIERRYTQFAMWVPELNKPIYAGRDIELRSDGVFRQEESSDVWGKLVLTGFLPYLPAGGMENRTARGIIIPSQGDLDVLPDRNSNKLSAQVLYRPAYLYASEAA